MFFYEGMPQAYVIPTYEPTIQWSTTSGIH